MSKYISENLTKDDVIDALKIILSKDETSEKKEKKTFSEKILNIKNETLKCFNDIVTLKFIADFAKDTKNDCEECVCFFKNFVTFKFLRDFLNDLEREPLDKAKLIKFGKKLKQILKEVIDTIVFVLVMVILIRFFICELRWIPSGSMKPTLIEGDRIVVERFSRFNSVPKRGDIMVFYPPFEKIENTPGKLLARLVGLFCKDTAYIKRVIGVPGDKIEIKADSEGKYTVYVNDKAQNEPYILSPYDYPPCSQQDVNCGPMVIPEHKYFMMGDNRGGSWDSRYWGFVPEDRFIGRAVFLFWPFTRVKSLSN
ncbi:signal peptidase I [bacterium]|nr:signal peptidase I [bacterium]